jgi:hypothetical protein
MSQKYPELIRAWFWRILIEFDQKLATEKLRTEHGCPSGTLLIHFRIQNFNPKQTEPIISCTMNVFHISSIKHSFSKKPFRNWDYFRIIDLLLSSIMIWFTSTIYESTLVVKNWEKHWKASKNIYDFERYHKLLNLQRNWLPDSFNGCRSIRIKEDWNLMCKNVL